MIFVKLEICEFDHNNKNPDHVKFEKSKGFDSIEEAKAFIESFIADIDNKLRK